MATTYIETATASDLNFNTAGVTAPATSRALTQTAPGASALTISLASAAAAAQMWFVAPAGDPSTTGGSGSQSYTVKLNVTTANANFTPATVRVIRLNSGGAVVTNLLLGSVTLTSTGVKTVTGSVDLGIFAAGDRFAFNITVTNAAMSVQSIIIEVGLANGNEEVTAPWTFSVANPAIVPYVRSPRSSFFCKALPRSWRERKSGILTPRLWTPAREPALA
jgi:hypothetical protein